MKFLASNTQMEGQQIRAKRAKPYLVSVILRELVKLVVEMDANNELRLQVDHYVLLFENAMVFDAYLIYT